MIGHGSANCCWCLPIVEVVTSMMGTTKTNRLPKRSVLPDILLALGLVLKVKLACANNLFYFSIIILAVIAQYYPINRRCYVPWCIYSSCSSPLQSFNCWFYWQMLPNWQGDAKPFWKLLVSEATGYNNDDYFEEVYEVIIFFGLSYLQYILKRFFYY